MPQPYFEPLTSIGPDELLVDAAKQPDLGDHLLELEAPILDVPRS